MSLGAAYEFTTDAYYSLRNSGMHRRLVDVHHWGSERLARSSPASVIRQRLPELVKKVREIEIAPAAGALHTADYSHLFRRKTKLELALISATVCGIEFCYSAETAFVSPTLLQIGVPVRYMSLIWCLPPIFGFLLVPFLGSCSDRCESRYGRRRPFVMFLAISIVLGLLFVPQGKRLGRLAGDPPPLTKESLRLARLDRKALAQNTTTTFRTTTSTSTLKKLKLKTKLSARNYIGNISVDAKSYAEVDKQLRKLKTSAMQRTGTSSSSAWPATHPSNVASSKNDFYAYLRNDKNSRKLSTSTTTTSSDDYEYINEPSTTPLSTITEITQATALNGGADDDDEDDDDENAQSHDVYGDDFRSARAPWAIFFSVFGVVMLDFGCDACQSPCRAYLLDVTVPSDHAAGLSTFTVLAGLGGACGYLMGSMHWEDTAVGRALGGQEQTVFLLVAILFLACISTTLTSFTELPLPELQRRVCIALNALADDEQQTEANRASAAAAAASETAASAKSAYRKQQSFDERLNRNYGGAYNPGAITATRNGGSSAAVRVTFDPPSDGLGDGFDDATGAFDGYYNFNEPANTAAKRTAAAATPGQQPQNPPSTGGRSAVDETRSYIPPQNLVSLSGHHPSLMDYLLSIIKMPLALRWLCLTNLFCWMSLVSYSLYFTDFVGQSVFGGNPGAIEGSPRHVLYEAGVRYGALCMSFYSVTCSIYSSMIERAVQRFGAKRVYIGGQAVYSVGMLILAFTRNRFFAMLTSCSAGIMYATLFTMPFLLVGHYHSTGVFQPLVNASTRAKTIRRLSQPAALTTEEDDEDEREIQQIRGLGTDIAIISSQVFAAQFILSSFVGSLVHASGSPVVIVVTASIFAFMGTLAATKVTYLDL